MIEILAYNASVPSPEAVGWMVQETADAVCDASNLMVGVALEGGVRDFSFYHYGIMPEPNFAWVRHAVELIKTAE